MDLATGLPIVGLPRASTRLERIGDDPAGDNSHFYVYSFIERLCVKYLESVRPGGASAPSEKVAAQTMQRLRRLLRISCVSIGAETTAAASHAVLSALNETIRRHIAIDDGQRDDDGAAGGECRRMTYKRALNVLMREMEAKGTRRDRDAGLVRHGDAATSSLWRSSKREYAATDIEPRLSEAQNKVMNLRRRHESARRDLRVARWQLAITTFTRCFRAPSRGRGGGGGDQAARREKRRYHRLLLRVAELPEQIAALRADLSKVVPYLELLSAASRAGVEAADAAVEQSGFQSLLELRSTGTVSTACPICLVEPPVRPLFTPCLHVMCHRCAKMLLAAAEIMESGQCGKCPLCRQPIDGFREMIEILPGEDDGDGDGDGGDDGGDDGGEGGGPPQSDGPPGFPPPARDADLERRRFCDPEPPRVPRRADLIALGPRFLSHFAQSRATTNPKLKRMLEIVRGSASKVVVFSQLAEGVRAAFDALNAAGMASLMLSANDKDANTLAIERFRIEEDIRALVLCVGSEGSGLTLTMSSRIVFLEPCFSISAEAQVRCRRRRRASRPAPAPAAGVLTRSPVARAYSSSAAVHFAVREARPARAGRRRARALPGAHARGANALDAHAGPRGRGGRRRGAGGWRGRCRHAVLQGRPRPGAAVGSW